MAEKVLTPEEQLRVINEAPTAVKQPGATHKAIQIACVAMSYIAFVITFAVSLTWVQAIGLYILLFTATVILLHRASPVSGRRVKTPVEKVVFWFVLAVVGYPVVFRGGESPMIFASTFALLPTSVCVVYMALRWRK
ncbi:hypothetical protein [Salininema proteolyticum]|uniref:Uncharacterized protein n=1 Tax=Salininema proteolyticum TaxID=1607685 RepID=A0ABV8TWU4_9ACTN